ncbi:hypothetical protein Tco_0375130 [Tanacetum coccineum]
MLLNVNNNKTGMLGLNHKLLMKMRMMSTLNDVMSNQFKNAEEYAYNLEQTKNYMENQIVWESRQKDIKRSKPCAQVFYGPQ